MNENEHDDHDIETGDDEQSTVAQTKPPEPPSGTERITGKDGWRLPDPAVEPTEIEKRRKANIEAEQEQAQDELPTDFKAALALQQRINRLPDRDPTKAARLKRIGLHVKQMQQGPLPPPTPTFAVLHQQLYGRKPTADELGAARKSLLKKK